MRGGGASQKCQGREGEPVIEVALVALPEAPHSSLEPDAADVGPADKSLKESLKASFHVLPLTATYLHSTMQNKKFVKVVIWVVVISMVVTLVVASVAVIF